VIGQPRFPSASLPSYSLKPAPKILPRSIFGQHLRHLQQVGLSAAVSDKPLCDGSSCCRQKWTIGRMLVVERRPYPYFCRYPNFIRTQCSCESWTLRKNEETRLDAFEMKGPRKILRVLWTAKKTNHWVLNKADTVKTKKLEYYVHMRKQGRKR